MKKLLTAVFILICVTAQASEVTGRLTYVNHETGAIQICHNNEITSLKADPLFMDTDIDPGPQMVQITYEGDKVKKVKKL